MNVTFNILTVKNCEKCENILKEQLHFIDRKHNFGFYFQIEFPQPLSNQSSRFTCWWSSPQFLTVRYLRKYEQKAEL